MNTIGGIHLFTALKSFATVLKTHPDFDALYEDVYHPVVTYYVACEDSPEDHRGKLEISDVTDSVGITPIGGRVVHSDSSGSEALAEAPANREPAAVRETPADNS